MSLVPDEPAVRRPALLPLVLGVPGWWLLGGILHAAALPFVPTLPWAISTRDRYATGFWHIRCRIEVWIGCHSGPE